jgi:hypothetical protein
MSNNKRPMTAKEFIFEAWAGIHILFIIYIVVNVLALFCCGIGR